MVPASLFEWKIWSSDLFICLFHNLIQKRNLIITYSHTYHFSSALLSSSGSIFILNRVSDSTPPSHSVRALAHSAWVADSYRHDDRGVGVWIPVAAEVFCTASRQLAWSNHYPIQWVPRDLPLDVKQSRRKFHHQSSSSPEVSNGWSCTSTPPYTTLSWGGA
jgi:hypothetical protein